MKKPINSFNGLLKSSNRNLSSAELLFRFRSTIPGLWVVPCGWKDRMGIYRHLGLKLTQHPNGRFSMEFLIHCSQCLFMLGIAAERYILISYAANAKTILSFWKRVGFFVILATVFLLLSGVPYYAFYYTETRSPGHVLQFGKHFGPL